MWTEIALAMVALYALGVAARPRLVRWLRRNKRYPKPEPFRAHQDGEPLGYRLHKHMTEEQAPDGAAWPG